MIYRYAMTTLSQRSREMCSRRAWRRLVPAVLSAAVLALAGCVAAPPATPPPTTSFQSDVDRYWAALANVCERGVTPEMRSLYAAARRAVESAGYGGGANSNFWGVRDPDSAYLDCRQAPNGWL